MESFNNFTDWFSVIAKRDLNNKVYTTMFTFILYKQKVKYEKDIRWLGLRLIRYRNLNKILSQL